MRHSFTRATAGAGLGASLALAALLPAAGDAHAHPAAGPVRNAVPTFTISTFASGSSQLYNPDGIVVTAQNVFVVYQNNSDHVNGVPSIVVKYDRAGNVLGQVKLIGRCDGMRLDPYTNQIWALLNNDGLNGSPPRQPLLYTIDPTSLVATLYHFPPKQPHGGGYDDVAFTGGHAFVSASSETLGAHGINNKPALLEVKLQGSNATISPIVYGNTYGYDLNTKTFARLNIADPDSLYLDNTGDLVLDSQADAQLLIVRHPGTRTQSISRLGVGTSLDDSAFTTGTSGTLFVADTTLNVIYSVAATFPAGTVFSEAPAGSSVQGFVGTLDLTTGTLTPLLTAMNGIVNPTSLVFVPSGCSSGSC